MPSQSKTYCLEVRQACNNCILESERCCENETLGVLNNINFSLSQQTSVTST